eukprot:1160416-Pelagomonas_calceolata.AAC.5
MTHMQIPINGRRAPENDLPSSLTTLKPVVDALEIESLPGDQEALITAWLVLTKTMGAGWKAAWRTLENTS